MTTFRPVVREDLRALIALKVSPDQEKFVATNAITLAQAAYEPGAEVFGIWDGHTAAGLMALIDERFSDDPEADPNTCYLWRLLIDGAHQRKGHGQAALAFFQDWAREKGLGRITLTVAPYNDAAIQFYENFGMSKTGRVIEREIELARDL